MPTQTLLRKILHGDKWEIFQKTHSLTSWKPEIKMVPFQCGRHCSWPTQGLILSSPYPLSSLRWSYSIILANEIQAEKIWLQFPGTISLPGRKGNSAAMTFPALPYFLLVSWNTSVMSWKAAAIQGPWGEPWWGWHHKSRGCATRAALDLIFGRQTSHNHLKENKKKIFR